MKVICSFCGSEIDNHDKYCKWCNEENLNYVGPNRVVDDPTTIEELKEWYIDRNLPPESVTRFFIGKNYEEARAFGIYQDDVTGEFVVYKNKADGTRAIRYRGNDERYAVNEIYLRLKEEIINQKAANAKKSRNVYFSGGRSQKNSSVSAISVILVTILFCLPMIIAFLIYFKTPQRGYYRYNNNYYYAQNNSWYEYNNDKYMWERADPDNELHSHHRNYFVSIYNDSEFGIDSFEHSIYYEEPSSSSSSRDYYDDDDDDWYSSSDWDSSDSWDSSSTDWDSDW